LENVYNYVSFFQGRIFEGKEAPQFVALFQPMVVLKVSWPELYGVLSSIYYSLEKKN